MIGKIYKPTLVGFVALAMIVVNVNAQNSTKTQFKLFGKSGEATTFLHTPQFNTAEDLPKTMDMPIDIAGKTYTLHLNKKSIRGENFKVLLQKDNGEFEEYNPGPEKTYVGEITELPNHKVSVIMGSDGVEASILTPEDGMFNLSTINTGASNVFDAQNRTILPTSVVADKGLNNHESCGVVAEGHEEESFTINTSSSRIAAGETVKRVELAFDIAFRAYRDRYSSNVNSINQNIATFVNNTMNTLWLRDVMVQYVLGAVVIRTSAATCPYEQSGNVTSTTTTLAQFRNLWNTGVHGTSHHLATLHVGGGGGGWAYVGTVNESNKYSVSDGGNINSWRGFNRHEIGHNWGLVHGHGRPQIGPNGNPVGIMSATGSHTAATHDESVTMLAERNSSNLPDIGPFTAFNVRPHGIRKDVNVGQNQTVSVNVLTGNYDANADAISVFDFRSTSHKGATITRSGNILTYTANAGTGVDRFYCRITDGSLLNWVTVFVNVSANSGVTVDLNKTRYDYDLGTPTSPVPNGWTKISPNTSGDISWSGKPNSVNRGFGGNTPIGTNLPRDLVYRSSTSTLNHRIKNGTWAITMNMGDFCCPHDNMRVVAEGVTLTNNLTSGTGQFPYVNGTVNVSDGTLNIQVSDNGGSDVNWVWNRLTLVRLGGNRKGSDDTSSVLVAYPNPAGDYITLDNQDAAELQFFTVSGAPALTINNARGKVDISSLSPGVYTLQITTMTTSKTQRLIKL